MTDYKFVAIDRLFTYIAEIIGVFQVLEFFNLYMLIKTV